MWLKTRLLLGGIVMVASFCCASVCSRASDSSTNETPQSAATGATNAPPTEVPKAPGNGGASQESASMASGQAGDGYCPSIFIPISLALVVGVCGAWCFYSGVRYGLIDRSARDIILKYLPNKEIPILFCLLGGIVAAVFQAAQPHVFAPIQAFVLGATWPSVVTRIMSGSGSSSGLTEMDPKDIKPPRGSETTPEPQVVIKS